MRSIFDDLDFPEPPTAASGAIAIDLPPPPVSSGANGEAKANAGNANNGNSNNTNEHGRKETTTLAGNARKLHRRARAQAGTAIHPGLEGATTANNASSTE